MGSPTGGPRDMLPPIVEEATPVNKSTNFSENKVKVNFDEFIEIKDLRNNLLVSPPLEKSPKILVKSKTLIISEIDELKPKTTYTISMGNAIVDLNEGNIYKDFSYVFSTGNVIDTSIIEGKVIDAYTHDAKDEMLVMAYKKVSDSIILNDRPDFIAKTNKGGVFRIVNVPLSDYHIFAVNDANSNMKWDKGAETFAFLDDKVSSKIIEMHDTIIENDTLYELEIVLKAFDEDVLQQYITDYNREVGFKLQIVFSRKLEGEITTELLDEPSHDFELEINPRRDTVIYWIKDSIVYNKKRLFLKVNYNKRDSLENIFEVQDTLAFSWEITEPKKKKEKKKASTNIFEVKTSGNQANLELIGGLPLDVNFPLSQINNDSISFLKVVDSVETNVPFEIVVVKDKDNNVEYKRKYAVLVDVEPGHTYRFTIDSGALQDFWGHTNDSISINLNARNESYYGSISLTLNNAGGNGVFQLLDDKETVLKELYLTNDSIVNLDNLSPRKYRFRYFEDSNKNKKWDTGDYLKKIQPETVYYYPETITVKSSWDNKLVWEIK